MNKDYCFYAVADAENVVTVVGYSSDVSASRFFTDVSKVLAFDDCTDEVVEAIYWKGELVHYAGWKPGMLYQFVDSKNKIVWEGCFPEWDH